MENNELIMKLLEIILKQNKLIIEQNNAIIYGLDCINDGLSCHHTPGYPESYYNRTMAEANEYLKEIDNIQKELNLSK